MRQHCGTHQIAVHNRDGSSIQEATTSKRQKKRQLQQKSWASKQTFEDVIVSDIGNEVLTIGNISVNKWTVKMLITF